MSILMYPMCGTVTDEDELCVALLLSILCRCSRMRRVCVQTSLAISIAATLCSASSYRQDPSVIRTLWLEFWVRLAPRLFRNFRSSTQRAERSHIFFWNSIAGLKISATLLCSISPLIKLHPIHGDRRWTILYVCKGCQFRFRDLFHEFGELLSTSISCTLSVVLSINQFKWLLCPRWLASKFSM